MSLSSSVSRSGDAAEREADEVAARVKAGRSAGPIREPSTAALHRQEPTSGGSSTPGSDVACEPSGGAFTLNPSLYGAYPSVLTTRVMVEQPNADPALAYAPLRAQVMEFERQIVSAQRIVVIAVPESEVFATQEEADVGECRDDSTLEVLAGQEVFTASGSFYASGAGNGYVFCDEPVSEAVAAGAVIVLETDGGTALIDAGLQLDDEAAAYPVATEVSNRLFANISGLGFNEAILSPGAPDGRYLMPYLAGSFMIGNLRATFDQYADPAVAGTIEAIEQAQAGYRTWLESALAEELEEGRAQWEASQPIAPNAGIRDQRWQTHVDEYVAQFLGEATVPYRHMLASPGADGALYLPDDAVAPSVDDARAAPALRDMSDTEWVPADDETIIVVGGGSIRMTSSKGLLMKPAAEPAPGPTQVPGLRPQGARGPTPAAARPAAPWIDAPTVGKAMQMVVRTGAGQGVLVDAGAAQRFLPDFAVAELTARLGVTSVDAILVTHPHADHVRLMIEAIKQHQIRAENIFTSENWRTGGEGPLGSLVDALQKTTDSALLELGYGETFEPGIAARTDGATRVRMRVPGGEVEIFATGKGQRGYRDTHGAGRSGKADSASLLYVLGNESSPHRAAVLGDLRGTDILQLAQELSPDGTTGGRALGEAMRGVRVLVGFGHHFGPDAGTSAADVRGYELLFRELMAQNGELTIVVQSSETFALGDSSTRGRALLEYATSLGARVVFVGEPAEGQSGGAVLDSQLRVQTRGDGVRVYEGEPRVRVALQRLAVLREASAASGSRAWPTSAAVVGAR